MNTRRFKKCSVAALLLLLSVFFFSCNTEKTIDEEHLVFTEGFNKINLKDQCLDGFLEGDTSLFSASKDFTVSLWLRSENTTEDTCIILSNSIYQLTEAGIYGWRRLSGGITLYCFNGGWGWNIGNEHLDYLYNPLPSDQPLADGQWHHLAFTHNSESKEIRLFYDGINKAILKIGDMAEQDFISALPLRLGERNNAPSLCRSFPGIVDKLSIWSSTISPQEIQKIYSKNGDLASEPENQSDTLTVLNWNIWHGGTHFTLEKDGFDGITRTAELIKESGADIILMQETYGAGPEISSSLGFYYYEASSIIGAVWGANLSVMSRYPFDEAFMVEEKSNYGNNYAFNNGGVKISLSESKNVIAFSNWYNGRKPEDLKGALKAWSALLAEADRTPIVFGGDFNSVSHLDDGQGESGHSKLMTEAGFKDSFREMYPDPKEYPGFSGPGGQDRIDYIYYSGNGLELIDSKPLIPGFKGRDAKTPFYPSDHLGFVSRFRLK